MNSENYLLSICIPTHNRSECLKNNIESIIAQQAFQDNKVEIVIFNNASTDDTDYVASYYSEKYEQINYFASKENMGDERFPYILSLGRGKLRKLSNDSVTYVEGSLDKLCKLIEDNEKGRPVLFFINKDNENPEIEQLDCDFKDFVLNASFQMTWISSFAIWEDECKSYREDFFGCDKKLWQVAKLLELVNAKQKCIIYYKNFMQVQGLKKKNISYGLYEIFYVNFFSLLEPYIKKNGISKEDVEFMKKDLLYNFFTEYIIKKKLLKRELEYSESENLQELVFNEYKSKPYWRDYEHFFRKRIIKMRIKKLLGKTL